VVNTTVKIRAVEGVRATKCYVFSFEKDKAYRARRSPHGEGGFRGLNPGPLAPKARIIPLDQIPGLKKSDVDARLKKVLGGFEPPSLDSKSRVITATL
jgi:hypothetical protein